MLQNIKRFRLSGSEETFPAVVRGLFFVVLVLSAVTDCHAQTRILDLGEIGPEDFQPLPAVMPNSDHPAESTANYFLPPIPLVDLNQLEAITEFETIQRIDKSLEQNAIFLIPPGVDEAFEENQPFLLPPTVEEAELQDISAQENVETLSKNEPGIIDQVAVVEREAISQIAGEYEVLNSESEGIRPVSHAEMPIIATHKMLEVAHRCSTALQAPVAESWIFWRKERAPKTPGPLRCSLQSRFVNWRLSATSLQGCVPEGYALRHFIETSSKVEFHASTLAENGPVDQGGSFEDAKLIEGDETRPIQQVSIDITPPEGELPANRAEEKFDQLPLQFQIPGTHRLWCGTSFYWNASLLNHQPLYFEDVNLERHGFSRGCVMQPIVSGVKFFGTLPALPYLMAADPPHETSFTLGQTRPGSHACYVHERPRLRLDASAVEAAAVVGLVFLIP